MPQIIALGPLKCYSKKLKSPHRVGALNKEESALVPFKHEAHRPGTVILQARFSPSLDQFHLFYIEGIVFFNLLKDPPAISIFGLQLKARYGKHSDRFGLSI